MRHISHRLAAITLLGAAGLTAMAAPQALAAPTPSGDGPSILVMTLADGTPDAPRASRTAILQCGDQAGGDHPAPAASCATLQADGLDFTATPTLQIMCPALVQPVTVTVIGVWNGNPVDYQRTYPNNCLMRRATGQLFDF